MNDMAPLDAIPLYLCAYDCLEATNIAQSNFFYNH